MRKTWPVAALICAALLATAAVGSGFIVANDYTEMQVDPIGFLRRLGFAWVPNIYLGYHSGFMHAYATPYGWTSALLQALHVPGEARQRVLDALVFFAIAAGAYWGIGWIAPATTRSARVCGAFVYLLNPYVAFNVGNGTSNMLAPYAALPFLVGLTALALRGRMAPLVAGAWVAIVTFFGGGINVPLVAMNAIVVVLYILIALVFSEERRIFFRRLLPFGAVGLLGALLLNLYWIAPFLDYSHTFWLGGLLDESPKEHSAESSYANVMRGLGQWSIFRGDDAGPWYLWASTYLLPFFSWLLWFPALFGAIGLTLRRRFGVSTTFFVALSALAIPLAVGYYQGAAGTAISEPFYDFLSTHVPLFSMFRSSYKWVWPYEFAVAGLVALAVTALQARSTLLRRYRISLRTAFALGPALLVLAGFGPILDNKMYHPNLPLPPWTRDESRFVGSDTGHRVALFPGQYLEWYDWLDRGFQLEAQLLNKPVVDGYMTGAPAEESHVILTRAYKLARAGDPRAGDIFRALSVDDVLQRDDYRSLMDFAFVGSTVPTETSLAHDILTRVIGARPHARDGANRLYALDGSRPLVFGTAGARLDPRPALVVAASGDYAGIARGDSVVSADGLDVAQFARVARALGFSADPASVEDAAVALAGDASTRAECFSTRCDVSLARAGDYRVLVTMLEAYPSDFREAFDLPGYDFTHADGAAVPGSIRIDGRTLAGAKELTRTWHDFGEVRLGFGRHRLIVAGALPTAPAYVAIVPADAWRRSLEASRRAVSSNSDVDLETAVEGTSATFAVSRDGRYAVAASRRSVLGTAPVRDATIVASHLRPESDFGAARWARPGATIDLPYVPASGFLALNPHLMPAEWYRSPSLYTWSRGGAVSWSLLKPESSFRVVVPFAQGARVRLTMRLAGVNHAVRPFRVFVDGKRAGGFTIGGGAGLLPGDYGRAPLGTEFPVQRTVTFSVASGVHEIRLRSPAIATWSARDVDPASAFTDQVVAAVEADMSVTARVPSDSRGVAISEPASRPLGRDIVGVDFGRDRDERAPFTVLRLPLASGRLDGIPTFSTTAATYPSGGVEFLAVAVADGPDLSRVRYRIVQNVGYDGVFGLTPSSLLPNSATDASRRILGAWVVLGLPDGRTDTASIEFALRDLHVERSLPLRVSDSALGALPTRVDGVPIHGPVYLKRGRHTIASAIAGTDLGVVSVRTSTLPRARPVELRVDRASAVSLDVSTRGETPPFVLVLNESFHSEWQATVDDVPLVHVHANGFANGWLVPASREPLTVRVRFTPQRMYAATAWTSVLSGFGLIGLIVWRRR